MDPAATATMFTMISLIASVASLALAVIAIWIALYGKREAERTNQKTQDLLTEIRSDAKSIAQYAIPELKAYGDSVRKFAFQKSETNTDSAPLLSKIENVLEQNMNRISGELDSIRKETDVSAIRRRLDGLETQLKSSQESVRKSVEDSSRMIHIDRDGKPNWFFIEQKWIGFLDYLVHEEGYKIDDYGKGWAFVDPITERRVPQKSIRLKLPFSELGIGSVDKLNLITL